MTELAREYGDGLFELARDERLLDQIHAELNELAALLRGEQAYTRLLMSHAITKAERLGIVDQAFRGRVHEYVLSFMKILMERGAFDQFGDCARHYHDRWCEEKGIVEAHVTTAKPLSEAQRQAIAKKLGDMSGRTVLLIETVDESIMGGLRVDMQGRRYDNTISHRLDLMRRHLAED